MKRDAIQVQLRERVKELKCLYALSRIAVGARPDVPALFAEVAAIVQAAMQHSKLARVRMVMAAEEFSSPQFKKTKPRMRAPFVVDNTHAGTIEVGYLTSRGKSAAFLPEERKLLQAVARELAFIIKRSFVEEEKQKLQLQLQHSERLAFVGELSAGIAHELNEPLGRILGFAQLIKKEGVPEKRQQDDLERIIKASLYAREIIKKLMLFSRQMPQQVITMDLNETIDNILYFLDVRYQSKAITMMRKLAPALPRIQADPVQISQVIVNLITNAIHAMPSGGALSIITQKAGQRVKLIVKDTGQGMSAAVRKKIFEPFFTTKPVGQGTGLGLSVVEGIVLAHHGTISVKSTVGRGTTFEITLPLRPEKRKRV
ncbi:MAG TPA: ATP-binding protein [Cyclobacteriaceae bacterium]|nr:ATP-binding protein [Cyclobacteriaceae bacterium]